MCFFSSIYQLRKNMFGNQDIFLNSLPKSVSFCGGQRFYNKESPKHIYDKHTVDKKWTKNMPIRN